MRESQKIHKTKLVLFGGKGGTGKTTIAAATALHTARSRPRARLLVVSTDPAHSLADSLGQPIGETPVALLGFPNLSAMEVNGEALAAGFQNQCTQILQVLEKEGVSLPDVDALLSLALPGSQEMAALLQVATLLQKDLYDIILLDTAPTGHTLRLLALPEGIIKWVSVFQTLEQATKPFMKKLQHHFPGGGVEPFLRNIREGVDAVRIVLHDPHRTEFVVVTLAEPIVLAETERLIQSLVSLRIKVNSLVINRVQRQGTCPQCKTRRSLQDPSLRRIKERLAEHRRIEVPLLPHPVRGVEDLERVGQALFDGPAPPVRAHTMRSMLSDTRLQSGLAAFDLVQRDLVLFVGKGGVGKTTLAASTAVQLAMRYSQRKVLLFSTDPAHSLSDVLKQQLTTVPGRVPPLPNLHAVEIDASQSLERLKTEIKVSLEQLFRSKGMRMVPARIKQTIIEQWFDLAPPGLDELMAMKSLIELRQHNRKELMIIDTAPTGHLLSFLRTPELVQKWIEFALQALGRYLQPDEATDLHHQLTSLRKGVTKLQNTLRDPRKSAFIAVTVPEAMGVLELGRMLSTFEDTDVSCQHVVFNMEVQEGTCSFCQVRRMHEQEQIRGFLERNDGVYQVTTMPLLSEDVRGVQSLGALGDRLLSR